MVSQMIVLGAIVSIAAVTIPLWLFNLLKFRDTERATRVTIRSLTGVVTGIAAAGVVIGGELIAALVSVIMIAPAEMFAALTSVLGYLTISGIISMQPETYGLLVVAGGLVVGVTQQR